MPVRRSSKRWPIHNQRLAGFDDDTQEAFVLAIEDGAIVVVERHGDDFGLVSGGARVLVVEADVRDFGAGVGDPGHHQVGVAGAPEEERVRAS